MSMNKRPHTMSPGRKAGLTGLTGLAAALLTGWAGLTGAAQAQTQTPLQSQLENAGDLPQTNSARPHSPALKSRTPVTLNFVNADIEAVTRAIGLYP